MAPWRGVVISASRRSGSRGHARPGSHPMASKPLLDGTRQLGGRLVRRSSGLRAPRQFADPDVTHVEVP
jgi:hypothetical protein